MPEDFVLSPRVQAARNVVAQQRPVVLPSPFGEAIAASADRLVDLALAGQRLSLQRERLGLERERTESLEQRRGFLQTLQRAEAAIQTAAPGVPLGEQNRFVQEAVGDLFQVDVATNPELANLVPNPLSPQDKMIQLRLNLIERFETAAERAETEEAKQQAAETAQLLREQVSFGTSVAEAREAETSAQIGIKINAQIDEVIDRVAEGEGSAEDQRFVRNMIAQQTGTPFRIDISPALQLATGEEQGPFIVDQAFASTLVSQLFQARREGRTRQDETLDELANGLVEATKPFPLDDRLARRIIIAAEEGDFETLQGIANRGRAARAAVATTFGLRTGADALGEAWLQGVETRSPILGSFIRNGLGQLKASSDADVSREDLLEFAKDLTRQARGVGQALGIPEDSLPVMIGEPSAWVNMGAGAAVGAGIGAGAGAVTSGGAGSLPLGIAGGLLGGVIGGATAGGTEIQGAPQTVGADISLEELLQRARAGQGGPPGPDEPEPGTGEEETVQGIRVNTVARALNRLLEEGARNVTPDVRREFDLSAPEIRELGRLLREGGGR